MGTGEEASLRVSARLFTLPYYRHHGNDQWCTEAPEILLIIHARNNTIGWNPSLVSSHKVAKFNLRERRNKKPASRWGSFYRLLGRRDNKEEAIYSYGYHGHLIFISSEKERGFKSLLVKVQLNTIFRRLMHLVFQTVMHLDQREFSPVLQLRKKIDKNVAGTLSKVLLRILSLWSVDFITHFILHILFFFCLSHVRSTKMK